MERLAPNPRHSRPDEATHQSFFVDDDERRHLHVGMSTAQKFGERGEEARRGDELVHLSEVIRSGIAGLRATTLACGILRLLSE